MDRNQRVNYENPWYRGYMPRSYIPPHFLSSYSCSVFLIFLGIFFILAGTIATVSNKHVAESAKSNYEDPKFRDPFFKKSRERNKASDTAFINATQRFGISSISIGAIFIIAAVTICCFAKHYMKKYEKKRQNVSMPLNEDLTQHVGSYPPPPPGSYPQQLAPPPGSYPQCPVPAFGSYPQQYAPGSYPQQPVITPTSYPQQPVPQDSYPYPPTTQPAAFQSQMVDTANPSPPGFKEV